MMRLFTFFVLSFFLLPSSLSRAASDDAKKMPELTKEERAKRADRLDQMAELHKKMAECLRSDTPMAECHEQMKKDCPMAKEGHCPLMDEMPGRRGRHGMGRMMKGREPEPEKK